MIPFAPLLALLAGTVACSMLTAIPGTVPGTGPAEIPRNVPSIERNFVLGQVPANVPGQMPATVLGQVPANVPGQVPATMPGSGLGTVPGTSIIPAAIRSAIVRTAAASDAGYRSDWSNIPTGQEPPEWQEVRADNKAYAWLYAGDWAIRRPPGGAPSYSVSPYDGTHPEPLTFRRFAGATFGPDGALPRRFRFEAEARSTGGASRFGGVGELAIQVLYVDPTHYLEVMQVDKQFRVWWADGAQPQQGEGWKLLGTWERPYRIGEWMTLGAEVDLDRGTLAPLCDGRKLGEIPIPATLRQAQPRLTIRATGNGEEWREIAIKPLRE